MLARQWQVGLLAALFVPAAAGALGCSKDCVGLIVSFAVTPAPPAGARLRATITVGNRTANVDDLLDGALGSGSATLGVRTGSGALPYSISAHVLDRSGNTLANALKTGTVDTRGCPNVSLALGPDLGDAGGDGGGGGEAGTDAPDRTDAPDAAGDPSTARDAGLDADAADAPRDLPTDDAPAVDPPLVDAPLADPPLADAPIVDAPLADAPLADPPLADAPLPDAPLVDPPLADAPAVDPPPDAASEPPPLDAPPLDTAGPIFVLGADFADCNTTCGALGRTCGGSGSVGLDCGVHTAIASCNGAGDWIYRDCPCEPPPYCTTSWGTSDVCSNNYNAYNAFCCKCL